MEEEEGEKEIEGEGEEEGEKEDKSAGPSPLLSAFYHHGDHTQFWVSMGGYDSGYLYRCSLVDADSSNAPYESNHTVAVPPLNGQDIPLHAIKFK